ncbi:MAG TPA: ATP-binding protein [Casimicrobiaceae bacterium]|nr:ATP-binding protein [Casimicrobiaceae bacterium]
MASINALDPGLLARARAEQVATLYTQWSRTTMSMVLGGAILVVVMWRVAPHLELALWCVAILLNQAWRYLLARRYRVTDPPANARERWGYAWALGSTIAGTLWGIAGVAWFTPGDPGHQALLIVCLFGVILGGLTLTTVFKPSFYGFVLPALLPPIARVAFEGDEVHLFIAGVLLVVLAFALRFGHVLNDQLTRSLAIRYENIDLIAELQSQTAAADRARSAAEAADRGKTQFLAAASHDLRQPLHAMGLFAATLSTKVQDPDVRNLVESINASVEALEQLFSTLLDISKLDAGAVVPSRASFPLAPLLARIEHEMAPLADAKGLRLTVVGTRARVDSDPVLLERIVANLVSNAIRYTTGGGVIVGARPRGSRVSLEVWDSGVGIAAAERERIFEEFYQIGNVERHSSKGMGLGLAITRRLAALLGHVLRVDSRPEIGSRFAVELPRAEPEQRRPASQASVRQEAHRAALAGALVAVIDDEVAVVDGMRALFSAWGAEVIAATSGDDLLAALGEAERYPDLIVADYRLARGELGSAVVARLRDKLGLPIPAVLISGDLSVTAQRAMRASGCAVLVKPVLPGELSAVSTSLLTERGRADAKLMARQQDSSG